MFSGTDIRHAMGTIFVCLVVVFSGFTFHAEGASSIQETQVIGYLSEPTILSCPHKVPQETLTEVTWVKTDRGLQTPVAKFVALPEYDSRFKHIIQAAGLQGRARVTYNTLQITSAKLNDGGHYGCNPYDDGRAESTWWRSYLIIYVRPENVVVSPVLDEGLKEGTDIEIMCTVQQVKPRPKIFWRIGDVEPMCNGSRADNISEHLNGTFSVQSWYRLEARHEDHDKLLYCIITLDGDRDKVLGMEKTLISIHYKPYGPAKISPLMLEMAEGSTDSLFCIPPSVPGNPAPNWFVWRMQNGTFLENTTSPELKLSPEYVNESHLYQCVAGNYLGESYASEWANVTVLDASVILNRDGRLVRGSGIVPLVVGVVLAVVLVICIIVVGLIVWRHKRRPGETYQTGGTKSALLSMESMPLQYLSNVSDVIRNHPDATQPPPVKPPRIYSYEHPDVFTKYSRGLPTPPPSPPAPLHECDNNKNVCATTQNEDKVPKEEIVYAELKHSDPGQEFCPPQPKEGVVYADVKFNNMPVTGN